MIIMHGIYRKAMAKDERFTAIMWEEGEGMGECRRAA